MDLQGIYMEPYLEYGTVIFLFSFGLHIMETFIGGNQLEVLTQGQLGELS